MIAAIIVMSSISLGLRLLPFIFARWLEKMEWLKKVGELLPACIILLLVAHCIESTVFGMAEACGLLAVIIVQVWTRNVLISMGAGVLLHQFFLWLL